MVSFKSCVHVYKFVYLLRVRCNYGKQPNVHYFKSLKHLAILSELVMTGFCICRAIVSLLSPTSSLRAFLTSLEYPPSTSTIILNCVTRYSGYLCSSFQRKGPYFVVFSASFSSLFSTHNYSVVLIDLLNRNYDTNNTYNSRITFKCKIYLQYLR